MASYEEIKIENIRIGERFRKDLGDIKGLAESIKEIGLLHPIVLTPSGWLVAGQRRIEAYKYLGLDEIPMVYASQVEEAVTLIKAERDENRNRLDMAPSEYVALGKALEALETPKARERKHAGQLRGGDSTARKKLGDQSAPKLPEDQLNQGHQGRVTELVSGALGVSSTQYKRARTLVDAAEAGDPKAVEAVQEMDRTGIVSTPYAKYKGQTIREASGTSKSRARIGPNAERGAYSQGTGPAIRSKNISVTEQRGVLDRSINHLEGIVLHGLASIETLRPGFAEAEITRWSKSIKNIQKVLRQLDKKLKEYDR